jgi:glutamate formiminotransferase/formiminotetrahydrofolate cyclodeaminase
MIWKYTTKFIIYNFAPFINRGIVIFAEDNQKNFMKQLIECVPNFSEGNDMNIINQIADAIKSVDGIKLLNVDPGKATNRTVMTFVGEPLQVIEAAFQGVRKAAELIDMSKHKGEHPRMGSTDVCPLIPVGEITMEETAEYARKLGKRVGEELGVPVYLYEAAQSNKDRSNLSVIRAGEYEGFAKKILLPDWKPDYGEAKFNAKSGATVIGARDFLIAYNVNLNTKSVKRANSVAFDIREAGRVKRIGDPISGPIAKDENGNEIRIPGKLKGIKAIGWYIEEYGIAQVSINITNFRGTPLHVVFDEANKSAMERGLRATGSELVGLIPLSAMIDAGKHYLKKQGLSIGVSEKELIHIAVKSMGLDELSPFHPEERIIEYQLQKDFSKNKLARMTLKDFADETASDSPAPGGGSIAAYIGALGISLGTMVANLSTVKKGWENRVEEFSSWAENGQKIKDSLIHLMDEDTIAFNKIMESFLLPKTNEDEKVTRKAAIQSATKYAIEIPFKVMEHAYASMEMIKAMAETGNPNSVSDAGVGALCARSAVMGAFLNVKINAGSLDDKKFVKEIIEKGSIIEQKAKTLEEEILKIVESKIK